LLGYRKVGRKKRSVGEKRREEEFKHGQSRK
jgi:hypothetical protein